MSRNIDTYTLRVEMISDLLDVYNEVAPDSLTPAIAYERVVKHPAKRFYITPKQVYQRVNNYIKGKTEVITSLKPIQQQQFYDLIKVMIRLQRQGCNRDKGLMHLCRLAVMEPAPRFYIKPTTFSTILSQYIQGQLDEYGRSVYNVNRYKDPEVNKAIRAKYAGRYNYIR